jgi:hypothetical protein
MMYPWEYIHTHGFKSTDFYEYKYGSEKKYPWITHVNLIVIGAV